MGKLVTLINLPGTVAEEMERLEQVRRTEWWTGEYVQRRKDGSTFWASARISLVRNAEGDPIGLVGIDRDVTERRRMILDLQEAKERNRAILDAVPDMILRIDRDGRFIDYSPGADISPYVAPEQFLGKRVRDVLPEKVADLVVRHLEETFRAGVPAMFEYELEREGKTRIFEARIAPVRGQDVLAMVRDVTEQRRVQHALEESELRFRSLIDRAADALYVVAEDLRFIDVNSQACELLGYSREELLTMRVQDIQVTVPPEKVAEVRARMGPKGR